MQRQGEYKLDILLYHSCAARLESFYSWSSPLPPLSQARQPRTRRISDYALLPSQRIHGRALLLGVCNSCKEDYSHNIVDRGSRLLSSIQGAESLEILSHWICLVFSMYTYIFESEIEGADVLRMSFIGPILSLLFVFRFVVEFIRKKNSSLHSRIVKPFTEIRRYTQLYLEVPDLSKLGPNKREKEIDEEAKLEINPEESCANLIAVHPEQIPREKRELSNFKIVPLPTNDLTNNDNALKE
eukprot:TRINITY_DN8213_c0_g1_i9.p1 TRINITY_DN8213_c0_g1~~TRINITY_DN8213_c0_g1_i9.p1  ORF type:complete len:242 (+),score=14.09 TRINITY_DN8213_c0_g1_i9:54-779(+)